MFRPRGLHFSNVLRLLADSLRQGPAADVRLFLCIADQYEPMHGRVPPTQQLERVRRWVTEYPRLAGEFCDSAARPPQHTFFIPADEYDPAHTDGVADLCRAGFGDVEVHLHHDGDTSEGLREKLEDFKRCLHDTHGLLRRDDSGAITYAFVHGNWALDNSRPDGRWCGVNDELTILRETGCYADFTMPSAPSLTQTRTINSIYYAIDDPRRPKSHDSGLRAKVGHAPPPEGLLMIQGPVQLDWRRRKFGVLPGLENADLHGSFPPTGDRLRLWRRAGVCVEERPDWLFVKLHTHGAIERNAAMLLGEPMRQFHRTLAEKAARGDGFRYYYVTAREMVDVVHAAERGAVDPCEAISAPAPTTAASTSSPGACRPEEHI